MSKRPPKSTQQGPAIIAAPAAKSLSQQKRKAVQAGAKPVAQDKLNAVGIDAITDMIVDGKTYRVIAGTLGVSLGVLSDWLNNPERLQASARAREIAAQTFDEMAEHRLDSAADPFALSIARELAVHYRWRAKAANPKRYGDKVAVGGDPDAPPINHSLSVTFVAPKA
ncbi:MAG: hypothetical protein H0W48_00090 [Methylibium sp.]|nr:hypothetical protein [Methylibium sp.]